MRIIHVVLFFLICVNVNFAQSIESLEGGAIPGEKKYEVVPIPGAKPGSYKVETLERKVPTIKFMVRPFSPDGDDGYQIIVLTNSKAHLWKQRNFCQTGMIKDGDNLSFEDDYTHAFLKRESADPFLVSLVEKFGSSVFSFVIRKERVQGDVFTEAILIQAHKPIKQHEWQKLVDPIKKFIGEYFQVNIEFGEEED